MTSCRCPISSSVRDAVGSSRTRSRAFVREALRDHHEATLGDREGGELAIRVDVRAEALEDTRRLAAERPPPDERAGELRVPEAELDVLRHRQVGDVGQLLVHEGEAPPRRVERAVEAHGLAVDDDLALVGLDDAREDLDQRALAGPVLPEQPDDHPGHDHAVRVIERDDARVALHDALDLDERRPLASDGVGGVGAESSRRRSRPVGRGDGAFAGRLGQARLAATVLSRTATIRIAP